ncbi:MAG TPA: M20/M25/M40 family metallo-hydrolase [Geminicoccus sp.]|uniref:M20/M25/M40 family metallo-hydrolase n=1 Tax=Geminicoccus sp. TaxID=2024832 RepID=UPI002E37CA8E|nr:M20/M25/M40 family metallo-hydrolase [Geminicoccus sp.]HEX2527090.1 M20/M25/M40 family metallo-hydrolase [Geminicoccus sp.]
MTRFELAPVLAETDRQFPDTVERLKAFLRFPSIGTAQAYHGPTRECAAWLANELSSIGFEAAVRPTGGMPMVVAHHPGPGDDAPHLLYYGHYDVQPVDPIELWDTPPFEPTVVQGAHGPRIVARGAVDDKGQVMTFVEAFRAWLKVHGTLPCRVTVFIEGEEEGSSPSLEPFMHANKAELQADVCVVSDTGMVDPQTPAITTSLRGLAYVEVTVHGPEMDLHSGMFGGVAVNPNNLLVRILAEMTDADGRVTIPGFYDGILEPSEAVTESWKAFPITEEQFLGGVGLKGPHGERGRSFLERNWTRPTLDINGIWGGYTGDGAKTVIPAKASAKISARLVPGQHWDQIAPAILKFVRDRLPPDCRMTHQDFGSSPGITVQTEGPWIEAARAGIRQVFGKEPVLMGCGGSIPVVGSFQKILGMETLLVGFGLDDDRVHSPNEKFDLVCLRRGVETHAAMLAALAGVRA